jgi:hypothetical protein
MTIPYFVHSLAVHSLYPTNQALIRSKCSLAVRARYTSTHDTLRPIAEAAQKTDWKNQSLPPN